MKMMSEGYAYLLTGNDWEIVVAPQKAIASSVGIETIMIDDTSCVVFATVDGALYAQAECAAIETQPDRRVDVLTVHDNGGSFRTVVDLGAFIRDNDFEPATFNALSRMAVGDEMMVARPDRAAMTLTRYA